MPLPGRANNFGAGSLESHAATDLDRHIQWPNANWRAKARRRSFAAVGRAVSSSSNSGKTTGRRQAVAMQPPVNG